VTVPRTLVTCVAEDRPGFHLRVEILLASLRRFGGTLAESPVLVNMVGGVEPAFAERLAAAGAEVRVVPRVTETGFAYANKLRMLEPPPRDDYDLLLAVDCDIAFAADPAPYLPSSAVGVVPADLDPFSERAWQRVFDGLGIAAPERSVRAGMTNQPMYPYFNSGVVAIPRRLCADLAAGWTQALHDVHELWQSQPDVVPADRRFYADQVALALALARGVPWSAANRALNFATHVDLHPDSVRGVRPALLHYHAELDASGFLRRPSCSAAEEAADRVNRARAEALGIPYTGLPPQQASSRARDALERLLSKARAVASARRAR
jgi:hypothetical protein